MRKAEMPKTRSPPSPPAPCNAHNTPKRPKRIMGSGNGGVSSVSSGRGEGQGMGLQGVDDNSTRGTHDIFSGYNEHKNVSG